MTDLDPPVAAAAAPTQADPLPVAPTSLPPLLTASGVTKRYGGIQALRGVNLEIRPGEVHALMGENGAGKSTLAKILAGVQQADAGSVRWRGEPVAFKTTAEARAAGVAIVLQELNLVPDLSVAENIYLTHASAYAGRMWQRRGEIRRQTRELADRFGWGGLIEPDRKVSELSVAEQQMAEILRALSWDAALYVLDEPTATLSATEVDLLFRTIRTLRDRGVAFLLVTHRLEEVFALADRITVYRDGANSGSFVTRETSEAELIRAMVGRDLGDVFGIRTRGVAGESVLEVAGLTRGTRVRDCSLTVRRGEVVAVAGLVGAGRTELIRAVFGADRAERGTVALAGTVGLVRSPREGIARRAGMVPEDRKAHGLLIDLPIAQNIAMATTARRGGFWLRPRAERALVDDMRRRLQIRAPDPAKPAGSLSGGNQQKVVLAKWLATAPDLLILDEPTRGIDVGTKHEVYRLIDDLAAAGTAVLLVSSELPEVLALADRILVMRDGAIVAELDGATATEEAILGYAA